MLYLWDFNEIEIEVVDISRIANSFEYMGQKFFINWIVGNFLHTDL